MPNVRKRNTDAVVIVFSVSSNGHKGRQPVGRSVEQVLSPVVMCSHLWSSGHEQVNLDACVTEALARSGNTINYDPDGLRCNVKRCNPTAGELRYNDVMYDVVVNGDDVTVFDYRLTDIRGSWDVYGIMCK